MKFLGTAFLLITGTIAFGQAPAFKNEVAITVEGDKRVIKSNGIPDHATGQFPNRGNPNVIAPQHYQFSVPAEPKTAEKTTALSHQPFGVALNGVVLDPGAAEWWMNDPSSGWQYEPLTPGGLWLGTDSNNAHVQPNGAYHYHGIPTDLLKRLSGGENKMVQLGWAADGFPIYGPFGFSDAKDASSAIKKIKPSYQLKKGERPSGFAGKYNGFFVQDYEYVAGSGDLDECNGRFGVTPEYSQGIYHYYITDGWPFIPRNFKGTPDKSFERRGPPPGGMRGRRPGGPGFPPPPKPPGS